MVYTAFCLHACEKIDTQGLSLLLLIKITQKVAVGHFCGCFGFLITLYSQFRNESA